MQPYYIKSRSTGQVLEADNSCRSGYDILLSAEANKDSQRWMFNTDTTIESLHCPGMVIGLFNQWCTVNNWIPLQRKSANQAYQKWIRRSDGAIQNTDCDAFLTMGISVESAGVRLNTVIVGTGTPVQRQWDLILYIAPTSQPTSSPVTNSPTSSPTLLIARLEVKVSFSLKLSIACPTELEEVKAIESTLSKSVTENAISSLTSTNVTVSTKAVVSCLFRRALAARNLEGGFEVNFTTLFGIPCGSQCSGDHVSQANIDSMTSRFISAITMSVDDGKLHALFQ